MNMAAAIDGERGRRRKENSNFNILSALMKGAPVSLGKEGKKGEREKFRFKRYSDKPDSIQVNARRRRERERDRL